MTERDVIDGLPVSGAVNSMLALQSPQRAVVDLFLETAGTMLAVLFLSAPMSQVCQLHASPKKINSINPMNLLSLHANCACQVIYGVFLPVYPAVPANLYGLIASFYYLAVCWRSVMRLGGLKRLGGSAQWNKGAAIATAVTLGTSLLLFAYCALHLHPAAAEHAGHVALVCNVLLFAAPLSAVGQVLRDKSSELLPLLQSLLGLPPGGNAGRREEMGGKDRNAGA
ncbi:unnamed protein product [Effrenium voratum]|nr:unnamed protein product [Effrenium voratum]